MLSVDIGNGPMIFIAISTPTVGIEKTIKYSRNSIVLYLNKKLKILGRDIGIAENGGYLGGRLFLILIMWFLLLSSIGCRYVLLCSLRIAMGFLVIFDVMFDIFSFVE